MWWWGISPLKGGGRKGQILDRVGNGYRLYILGDLNGWTRDCITGAFGFPGENYNARRVLELCAEKALCVPQEGT